MLAFVRVITLNVYVMCLSVCMCVCVFTLSSVCFPAYVCVCAISSAMGREWRGRGCGGRGCEGWGGENDPGPIHMKQEGSYINIAPRPRGQAIYEANCSPVSHGGRTVYYAWGLVTCFKATPQTGWLDQWLPGVVFFYHCGFSFGWKTQFVVAGVGIMAVHARSDAGDAAWA